VVSPPGTGTVDVTVTVGTVTSPATSTGQFAYQPDVSGISPASGPVPGGTPVMVTGSGFAPGATVDFGSVQDTNVTVMSDTEITVVSPPGTGTVDVTVTVGTLTSPANGNDQFTYQPDVSGISPANGLATGGTMVMITGNGFKGSGSTVPLVTVEFGSVQATNVMLMSGTEITAVSPPDAGTVDVTVTVDGVTLPTAGPVQFSYQPVIKGIHPRFGIPTDHTPVEIFGVGFTSGATVMFGSTPATSVTFISSTDISADSPYGTANEEVAVTVTVGTLSSAPTPSDLFTYL
jgi:hypothetical protein